MISICFALTLIFLFNACKKDDDGNNDDNPSCYILRLTDNPDGYIDIKFTYNNQNQLTRMDVREDDYEDYKTMQYDDNGNVARIDYYDEDGSLAAYQTFEYNNGKVSKGHEHSNNSAEYDYSYNSDGMLESITLFSSKSVSRTSDNSTKNCIGLLSSRLLEAGADTKLLSALIEFRWTGSSITKESWTSGGTLLESYDYTYDNKINPFKQFNFPVPIIGGTYAKTLSSNNFTKEVWYSAINDDSQTTTATYQYNSNNYPTSRDGDYRMEYRCN